MSTLCSMLQRTGWSRPFPASGWFIEFNIKRYHRFYDSDPIHPVEGCTPQEIPFWHLHRNMNRFWSILGAWQIGVRKWFVYPWGVPLYVQLGIHISIQYMIPTRNDALITTISRNWRLATKAFQNLHLPLHHPISMPNMFVLTFVGIPFGFAVLV